MEILPFLLEPVLKPKPWGGRNLEKLFRRLMPKDDVIGESWELSARPGSSNSITSGIFSGKTLLEVIQENPDSILGSEINSAFNTNLPILAKFIDTSEWLSIQVHPDDCIANALKESDPGKEEAWLVVDARPGASLILGTSKELSFDNLVELCKEGRYGECLNYIEAQAGDVIAVPPGTLHAVGKGITLFEVSSNSDLTYRVDDWNRNLPNRELHYDKARESLKCGPPVAPERALKLNESITLLHKGQRFKMLEVNSQEELLLYDNDSSNSFSTVTTLSNSLTLENSGELLEIPPGRTAFIPSSSGKTRIIGNGRAILLKPVNPYITD